MCTVSLLAGHLTPSEASVVKKGTLAGLRSGT